MRAALIRGLLTSVHGGALGLMGAPLAAAIGGHPLDVEPESVGGQAVEWVDWGDAGAAQARDPARIGAEAERLRAFLRSVECRARLLAIIQAGQARETALARAALAQAEISWQTREQPTALPRLVGASRDELPLPPWADGLPLLVRTRIQVLLFDDRDQDQRDWALTQTHDAGILSFAYCTGWSSGQDRDGFWRAHPALAVHAIATDQFAQCYGVTAYPARVRFGAETMTIDQGLDR
jgi:hypothetical protein